MSERFIRKLQAYTILTDADHALVRSKLGRESNIAPLRTDIITQGQQPTDVKLISDGFACRYKLSRDGRRQIVGYLVPGDICDLHALSLSAMDHSISALTQVTFVRISHADMKSFFESPRLAHALSMVALTSEAIAREWIANYGRHRSEARIVHFLCEWFFRLKAVGLVIGNSCPFPITQAELGETVGLSTVHVNRAMMMLARSNIAAVRRKSLSIPDLSAAMDICDFDSTYLHIVNDERMQRFA